MLSAHLAEHINKEVPQFSNTQIYQRPFEVRYLLILFCVCVFRRASFYHLQFTRCSRKSLARIPLLSTPAGAAVDPSAFVTSCLVFAPQMHRSHENFYSKTIFAEAFATADDINSLQKSFSCIKQEAIVSPTEKRVRRRASVRHVKRIFLLSE